MAGRLAEAVAATDLGQPDLRAFQPLGPRAVVR